MIAAASGIILAKPAKKPNVKSIFFKEDSFVVKKKRKKLWTVFHLAPGEAPTSRGLAGWPTGRQAGRRQSDKSTSRQIPACRPVGQSASRPSCGSSEPRPLQGVRLVGASPGVK